VDVTTTDPYDPQARSSQQWGATGEFGESTTAGGGRSTTDAAKEEAGAVKDTAKDAASNVAGTAKSEASNVVGEATQQAKGLLHTVRSEVRDQAGTQQNRIADALHGLSKELGGMASSSEQSGPLTDLAHEASRRGGEIAHWLQNREPADVLTEVKRYARRHPVTFLLLCGAAGVVAGRLTRGAVAANTSLDSPSGSHDGPRELQSNYATPTQGYASAPVTYTEPTTYTQPTYTEPAAAVGPASLVDEAPDAYGTADPNAGVYQPGDVYPASPDPAVAPGEPLVGDDLRPGSIVQPGRTDTPR
jgi:uncharacterized protein YjbJ (UPF0337 family)